MSEDTAQGMPGLTERLRTWHAGLDPLGRQRLYIAAGLAATLIGLAIYLLCAPAPWEGEAPKLLERSQLPDGESGRLESLPTEYWSQVHLWKAAATNAVLVVLLLISSPLWVRWAFVPKVESPPRIGRPISKLSIFFLLGALILATCLRLPLMDRHIHHGEQDNLRRSIHGYIDLHENGSEDWQPTSWNDAFHENLTANNPILLSITAKAALGSSHQVTRLPEDRFAVVPIRLPSLLAGLASIFLLWRILHWFGYRCAALFGAFFLAIHPSAIGFHVHASGYSLSMFFELLAIASVYLALRTLKWRYWVTYGASIMLCLYADLGAIYFAIGLNLFVGLYLLRRIWHRKTRAAAWPQFVRFGIANLVATMIFLQAARPALAQANSYRHENSSKSELPAEWVFFTWDHIVAGTPLPSPEEWWDASPEQQRPLPESLIHSYLPDEPVLAIITLLISPVLLVFGTARLVRSNRYAAPLALGGLVAPALAYAHSQIVSHQWSPTWYISYALPIFIMLFSIGITSLSDFFKNKKLRPYITLGIGTAYLILFSICTAQVPEMTATGPASKAISNTSSSSVEILAGVASRTAG